VWINSPKVRTNSEYGQTPDKRGHGKMKSNRMKWNQIK
jgi:hypothetical protein